MELGAGQGRDTIPLLQAGFSLQALDFSGAALDELRRRAHSIGLADTAHEFLADLIQRESPSGFVPRFVVVARLTRGAYVEQVLTYDGNRALRSGRRRF